MTAMIKSLAKAAVLLLPKDRVDLAAELFARLDETADGIRGS